MPTPRKHTPYEEHHRRLILRVLAVGIVEVPMTVARDLDNLRHQLYHAARAFKLTQPRTRIVTKPLHNGGTINVLQLMSPAYVQHERDLARAARKLRPRRKLYEGW